MPTGFNRDAPNLTIETRRQDSAVVLALSGEVTVFTSPALRKELRQAADTKPPKIIFDLAGTRYVDSSGVATMVEGLQIVSRYGGRLLLAGMNDRVRGVFEISRLHTVFTFAESVEEALEA